ncbi:DUF433 domain-containing protein [Halolamina sediminis]|jgi:uncharacterized protein (DUF433 family)|uniref:DUF433 domain-containing protein n=1 Tax=Halolamina sediminis TaxID=1480675 RepID=UPI0006B5C344|nr:DUF433 domain-containing protein [Halolamina sediminis]
MTEIVRDDNHSDGSPTVGGTGIRVENVADAYEYSGYSPDEIVDHYPTLTLQDVHAALAYFYGNSEEFDQLPKARNNDEEAT